MKKLILSLLVAIPAVAFSQNVQPYSIQVLCGPTVEFKKVLEEYREVPQWDGADGAGFVITVWENKTSKSFSVLKTSKDGTLSCLMASSMGFQN